MGTVKGHRITSSTWDILKENVISVSYTPVLVNLAGLFSHCSSFVF